MNKRATQIKQLQENLKLQKLKGEELITFTMSNFDVSRRTAREYINVALFNIK